MWNLNGLKQEEEEFEYVSSLSDDEMEFDNEADKDPLAEPKNSENDSTLSSSSTSSCTSLVNRSKFKLHFENHDILSSNLHVFLQSHESEESEEEYNETEEWGQQTDYFDNLVLDFQKEPRITHIFDTNAKEIDYFNVLWGNDIFQLIANETNSYVAESIKRKSNVNIEPGPSKYWEDTNVDELKALIGILIIMGIHSLPQWSNYWSTDPYLNVASVSRVMSSKRYKKIIENLRLNNNSKMVPKGHEGYDKLYKVRSLIEKLNHAFQSQYEHSSFLSIDESTIPFKAKSLVKQYMPLKSVKKGYKVWCLADSANGYIYKFNIYTEKSENIQEVGSLAKSVVMNLTQSIKDKNCVVAFDSFFTSLSLMKKLEKNNIYAVGNVRIHKKGLPDIFRDKTKLERGEFVFKTKNKIAAVKWMDNKPLSLLSNFLSPREMTTIEHKRKDGSKEKISCPVAVKMYNQIMSSVDRFDQLYERYSIGRRSIKWWYRIFYYLIDMAIVNSYIIMNQTRHKKINQLSYRINLARQLISGFTSRKHRYKSVPFLANKCSVPNEVRLANVGEHLPTKQSTYRRCRLCSTKAAEKRTRYNCKYCNVPLCIDPCFNKFHGQ